MDFGEQNWKNRGLYETSGISDNYYSSGGRSSKEMWRKILGVDTEIVVATINIVVRTVNRDWGNRNEVCLITT